MASDATCTLEQEEHTSNEMEMSVDKEEILGEDQGSKHSPQRLRAYYLGACYAVVLCGYYTANSFVSVM